MGDTVSSRSGIFSKITTREAALKTVRDATNAFLILAAIQATLAILYSPPVLLDAILFALFAVILRTWNSRVAAILLLLLASLSTVTTIYNLIGRSALGGNNLLLAVIVLFISIRALEATSKLHGSLREPSASHSDRSETQRKRQ